MIALLLLLCGAWADPVVHPLPPAPGDRPVYEAGPDDCPLVVPLRKGEAPPSELLDDDGHWRCDAVLVPAGTYRYDLALGSWGDAQFADAQGIRARWRGDTIALEYLLARERDQVAALSAPTPFFQRAGTIHALYAVRDTILVGLAVGLTLRGGIDG